MAQFGELKSLIQSLKTEFSNNLLVLNQEINDKITNLKNEFSEFKTEMDKRLVSTDVSNNDMDDIVEELAEQHARKQNIIVFGISEQSPETGADLRIEADKVELSSVLKSCVPTMDLSTMRPHRLGRYSPTQSRPRPIKVTLASVSDVHSLIKNTNKLKNTPNYSKISISYDRTPKQLSTYKKLKQQLNDRISSGENNITIKYVRGVPKIVTKPIPLN